MYPANMHMKTGYWLKNDVSLVQYDFFTRFILEHSRTF